jgi:hypothetical protein
MRKIDGMEEGLDRYFIRKFEELGLDAQALRNEIEVLRVAEEGVKMTEKELREMIQNKEAELKRLILQKQLAL